MNRRNRSFFNTLLFVALGAHLVAIEAGLPLWLLLAGQFLLYPQLVYWRACLSKNQRQAEMQNLLADAVLGGMWAAGLGLPLWIDFTLFAGNFINMVVFYGYRGILWTAATFGGGAAIVEISGLTLPLHLSTDLPTTLFSVVALTLYFLAFAHDGYQRAMDQHRGKKKLQAQFDEIRMLQAQLQEQAVRDPLTGLFNRRHLDVALPAALQQCRADGSALALVLIDIDHFKRINDAHGHAAGDATLQMLSQLMLRHVRPVDIACRYGGEEFLVVMAGVPAEAALERAEALRKAFETTPLRFGDGNVSATLSCGVAAFPDQGHTPEALIRQADQALYQAKALGRNQVVVR